MRNSLIGLAFALFTFPVFASDSIPPEDPAYGPSIVIEGISFGPTVIVHS